ncbi:Conserved_hypothetical protein [Hexamita inflata]|nr:Conserved hypothetical protein [Hexamita inflata]
MDEELELRVYFDEDYHFLSRTSGRQSVHDYLRQLEKEYYLLFNEQTQLAGLQNVFHTDIPTHFQINQAVKDKDAVFPLRSIVSTQPGKLVVQILKLPAFDAETQQLSTTGNPRRCVPYCQPLSKFGTCNSICQVCGEVKSYLPCNGQYCTRFCYS